MTLIATMIWASYPQEASHSALICLISVICVPFPIIPRHHLPNRRTPNQCPINLYQCGLGTICRDLCPFSRIHPRLPPTHPRLPPTHPRQPPIHPLTPPIHPLTPPTHPLTPPIHPLTPPIHPRQPPTHPQLPPIHPLTPPTDPRLPPIDP